MYGSFWGAVGLGQAGREHVGYALSLMIVAAVQNREKVHVANERRLATQCWFGSRFDELAFVESRFVTLPRARIGINEYLERCAAEKDARARLRERRSSDRTRR